MFCAEDNDIIFLADMRFVGHKALFIPELDTPLD